MKTKNIKIPLYFEKFKIVCKKKLPINKYAAYINIDKKAKLTLYINPKAPPSIIAHEAVHLANITLHRAGVIADFNNDEAQTYLVGWFVEKITKKIKRNDKTSRKNS